MDIFSQLRHLYVNVRNDVCHLQETAKRPTKAGLSHDQVDKLLKEPLWDVRLQKEKVRGKIKEVLDETHFGEVVTCCSDLMNYSLVQLDQLEQHLQKYSVQPIGNARQRCESESSVPSNQNELPAAVCNPSASTAVSMVTELCQPQVEERPVTHHKPGTPNPADFGISESVVLRLNEATTALLKKMQKSHANGGQVPSGSCILNSADRPAQLSCHSSPLGTNTTSSQDLNLDISAILSHDQNQDGILPEKPAFHLGSGMGLDSKPSNFTQSVNALALSDNKKQLPSSLAFPLKGISHAGVRFPEHESVPDRLEFSSSTKSILKVLDVQIPPLPQQSDLAKKTLDFCTVVKEKAPVSSHSKKKVLDSSPSLSTLDLSEQTMNILHQLQLSKISTSGIKPQLYSARKLDENVPPDHPSVWKSSAVNNGHTAAKKRLDMRGEEKTRDAVSSHIYDQNFVSATAFLLKTDPAASAVVKDETSHLKGSSVKSHRFFTETSLVLGHGDGKSNVCRTGKPSCSGFESEDLTCPKIRLFSLDEYESFVPAAIKNVVSLGRINDSIEKANELLFNKMMDGRSTTLSVEDLKHVVGDNANLFLKVISKTGRLTETTGERGTAEYKVI